MQVKFFLRVPAILLIALVFPNCIQAQLSLDVEGNYGFSVPYNTVRIPSAGGTKVDIANDLNRDDIFTFRFRASYAIKKRHIISALVAPLTIKSSGTFGNDVIYSGVTYPANQTVQTKYVFNSYRLTYRYLVVSNDKLNLGFGLTAKLRQANISFNGQNRSSDYPDLGIVPLVNFFADWKIAKPWSIVLEGDALGTRQGRAEDIFLGAYHHVNSRLSLKAGYRVLEGGADVEKNYNFTWVNYAALGAVYKF